MNMPPCDTRNIMANKVRVILLSKLSASFLIMALLLCFSLVSYAYAQEKKQEPKPGAAQGSSIEEERLKVLKADLQSQMEQLKKLKQELEEQRKGAEGKKQEQTAKVVKMFEAMPAEEAAKTLEKLDDDTAVLILISLKAKSAGKVLAQIDPARAAALSKKALLKAK